jgi:cAMP-binding proteins - catabolite gene activator and regulatory subunit of cAMP-dependent protein kinases
MFMKMHPADTAKELRTFAFFKSFSEDLLLQIATMVRLETFPANEVILKEGQTNHSLFFLKSGKVEVSLLGEVLASLETPGEVLGEMSVITGNPAATTVKTLSATECLAINADDFSHVHPKDADRLKALLFQIYCVILTDRLTKTNEKARLFEILNRELHEAQNTLEKNGGARVLLVEHDKKQQLPVRMALGGTGVHLEIVDSIAAAKDSLMNNEFDIVLADENSAEVLQDLKGGKGPRGVLLTSKNVEGNLKILRTARFVENIISRDPEDRSATVRFVLTTLGKIFSKDIFGLEKYMQWGVEPQMRKVARSDEREQLREEMMSYFKKMGVRSSILDRANTVVEEMLMNAIYDAPVDAQGNSLFNHVTRKDEIELDTHQQGQLRYGSDGTLMAVSVSDPFGALTKELIVDYLLSCYTGKAGEMNTNKGGAGRGLHQIIENSDLTIFNVKKGVRTEVISLFNLDGQKREAQPSFHYFFL